MNLAEFVSQVVSGKLRIVVGGRDGEGRLVSGFADPAGLTDEQVAAEAFANDVDETSSEDFESVVELVSKLRAGDGGQV